MNKKIMFSIFFVFFLVPLFVGVMSYAFGWQTNDSYWDEKLLQYTENADVVSIHNLHVDAIVNKDNTLDITETFSVRFNEVNLSEVVRIIPYKNRTYREDKKGKVVKTTNVAQIYNIEGSGEKNEKLNLYYDEEEGYITIGLKSSTYFDYGEVRNFSIKYTYSLGKDYNKGFDDYYFNIVGTKSFLTIRNISFSLTLPTNVSETQQFNVYYGRDGSRNQLDYQTNGNVITGNVEKLGPLEGITFRAVYPDGFIKGKISTPWVAILAIIVAAVVLTLSILCFINYKQRDKVHIPVEVNAPEGLNPMIAEYMDSHNCTYKSIIASIVYFASKGYLSISEKEEGKIKIKKLKDIDDRESSSISRIFKSLFSGADEFFLDYLPERFIVDCDSVISNERKLGKENLYDKEASRKSKNHTIITAISICLVFAFMIFAVVLFFGFFANAFFIQLLTLFILTVFVLVLFGPKKYQLVSGGVLIVITIAVLIELYIKQGFRYIDSNWLIFVSILLLFASIFFIRYENKYSEQGKIIKGRVLGFKNFIKKCEVAQIEAFVKENPAYYFDVLPYAYVFDLSNTWIKKFENINIEKPEWIDSDDFNSSLLVNMPRKIYSTRNSVYHARASSSGSSGSFSGGGGGGGGFSGGGSGGGGFGAR